MRASLLDARGGRLLWRLVRMRTLFRYCIPFCLLGCGSPRTLHPTVIVDSEFAAEADAMVREGATRWEDATPKVHLPISTLGHQQILNNVFNRDGEDVIYVVRVLNQLDPDCPCRSWTSECTETGGPIGFAGEGMEFEAVNAIRIICLDQSFMVREPHLGTKLAMHEFGHALGLRHMPLPSVMDAKVRGAEVPTPEDVAALEE